MDRNISEKATGAISPNLKPVFNCKLGSRCVTNTIEMSTNNMKCTWPIQIFCISDSTQPIFHWLALGFCVGGNANLIFCVGGAANFSVFRYQHVGISNTKLWCWRSQPMPGPNTNGFCVAVEYRLKATLANF